MTPEGWGGGACGCREALHRLYHYLDGELDDGRRDTIRRHLEECMPCLEAFDFEAALRTAIARTCREPVPESLRDRVLHAIHHEVGPRSRWGWPGPRSRPGLQL